MLAFLCFKVPQSLYILMTGFSLQSNDHRRLHPTGMIFLYSWRKRYPGIIMELKLQRDMDGKQIDNLKDKALSQIISSGMMER